MKKITLLILAFVLITPIFSQIRSAYAISSGFERYKDDECEVYFEYFPIIPYDPNYPTASEEFPFIFEIIQDPYWKNVIQKYVPWGFDIEVWFANVDGFDDFVTWKRWYPLSVAHRGLQISWRLTIGGESLSLGTTVKVEDLDHVVTNYTEYEENNWLRLAFLDVYYACNTFWEQTTCMGGGSIGVQNDLAQNYDGDWCLVKVDIYLYWITFVIVPDSDYKHITFYFGDDIPSDTDCWLTVEQGNTHFDIGDGDGGGGCPTLFVWNGSTYESEGTLNIHADSDVTVQHEIQNTLALKNGVYDLQLRELQNNTSHIDQVKLYAVDDEGEWHNCPLTYAYHNELGKVKHTIRFDDDERIDLKPTEMVSLEFAPPISYNKTAQFIFEINGYNMKWPGD